MEARAGALNVEIVSAGVKVANDDQRDVRFRLCQPDAPLKEWCLGQPLLEIASGSCGSNLVSKGGAGRLNF